MSNVGIVTLPGANVSAVSYWLKRGGVEAKLVSSPDHVTGLECLILPGVGAFDSAMDYLDQTGLRGAIIEYANCGGCLIGICLGMQIMFESSDEGIRAGLGLIAGRVRRIPGGTYRVPNIGWRSVVDASKSNAPQPVYFFMHSYGIHSAEFTTADTCSSLETIEHNVPLVASFRSQNLIGMQYHPEKSYVAGDHLISEILYEIQSNR